MARVYTCNRFLAAVLTYSPARIQYIQCISPRYGGPQRRVCRRCRAAPLIVGRELAERVPVLLVATPLGAVPAAETSYAAETWTPWGTRARGYVVPVARHGFLRGICVPEVDEGVVTLLCPGEPDWDAVRPLRRAAERIGARVEVAHRRLYDEDTPYRIAEHLERRIARDGRVVVKLFPYGLSHVVMAAVVVLVEEYGYAPGREVAVAPLYPAGVNDRERNVVKAANDYMCAKGDKVACLAARGYHVSLWPSLVAGDGPASVGAGVAAAGAQACA